MEKRSAFIAGLVAAVLGGGCLFVYMDRFEAEAVGGAEVPVLIAVRELPLGTVIREDMLGVRDVPARYVEARHVPASELRRVIGVRLSAPVRASESILWNDLADYERTRNLSGLVQQGMRAVTIRADASSTFGGLLRPGDRVDVLLTVESDAEGGERRHTTHSILQNVLVLAIGRDTGAARAGETENAPRVSQITVSATPDQGQRLALAEAQGSLALSLRNPQDIEIIERLPSQTSRDLLREARADAR